MNRIAQGMVLVLLGTAALTSTVFTDLYLNYVQAWFRPFLIASGVVLVALGLAVIVSELRLAVRGEPGAEGGHGAPADGDHGGHDHATAPRVAWLLLLPVVSVFVIAPPALGAYTAENAASSAPPSSSSSSSGDFGDLGDPASSAPVELKLQEFVMRAWTDEDRAMADRTIKLTGFVVPHPDGPDNGWYLARLQMACCAADAIVNRVLVTEFPGTEPPEKDTWWTVQGTWQDPDGDLQSVRDHRFSVEDMTAVENPPDPYE
ncbi:TIGR03943 family putative permease subunit [Nocardiopsis sediminis]|uniref:TIGR03943 family putative permease subunit n=1 Tax=Nocardiopsis sediminis TaxID=1778267 RepID=A0ABV8FM68_9ACTN